MHDQVIALPWPGEGGQDAPQPPKTASIAPSPPGPVAPSHRAAILPRPARAAALHARAPRRYAAHWPGSLRPATPGARLAMCWAGDPAPHQESQPSQVAGLTVRAGRGSHRPARSAGRRTAGVSGQAGDPDSRPGPARQAA
jgi:hypothetical protein